MAIYSHSKLNTFQQCRYKYKLQYIDKIKVDIPTSVEAFMGDLVHRTLEKLYKDLRYQKLNRLEDLLKFFNETWQREWTDDILIVKKGYSSENYMRMGEKYISVYYDHYKPFNQLDILGLETQDKILLPDGNYYHVRIDKLGCKADSYYVCDYKTNMKLMTQEEADGDRQLAMYSIWVKNRFSDAVKITLLWHMLAFNKEVISERTEQELGRLQEETMDLIRGIESCSDFPTNVTALCSYCVYQEICPSFKHQVELKEKPVTEFKDDDGVKLVDEYANLKSRQKEIEKRLDELKAELVIFSKQKEIDTVYGSNMKVSIKEYERIVYPEDKTELINTLKQKGLYDEFSMLSYPRLNSKILKGEIDEGVGGLVRRSIDHRLNLSKKKKDNEE